jgi:hypothetical protein
MRHALFLATAAMLAPGLAQAQTGYKPPEHTTGWPGLAGGESQSEMRASIAQGPELQRGRPARWQLAEHGRVSRALAALQPGRKGVVDAYVVSIALDSDPVFGREAREAGKVLSRRYGAAGRTLVFAGTNGSGPSELPLGSISTLTLALARVAEVMNAGEDVLVLYVTTHGSPAPLGIAYHDGDEGFGFMPPARMAAVLEELGIRRRVLLLSACYSGIYVPDVSSDDTALITAAAADRTSFGCRAENDWTFFGDAMINRALRKPQGLEAAFDEARGMIGQWEAAEKLDSSAPQISMGSKVAGWLGPLEARIGPATAPVGRPATEAFD